MQTPTTTTIAKRDTMLVITGEAQFDSDESAQIKARMTPETEKCLNNWNREFMLLDSAESDLMISIKRKQRDLRECKEYIQLQQLKLNLKQVRAQRSNIRIKALGIFESLLSGVRKGTSLHKKIVMMLSMGEEG